MVDRRAVTLGHWHLHRTIGTYIRANEISEDSTPRRTRSLLANLVSGLDADGGRGAVNKLLVAFTVAQRGVKGRSQYPALVVGMTMPRTVCLSTLTDSLLS